MSKEIQPPAGSTTTNGDKNVHVLSGETLLVSPDSQRFKPFYKQLRPRSIDEVHAVLGLTEKAAKAVKNRSCCEKTSGQAALVAPEDLVSEDNTARFRARKLAYQVAQQYINSADPSRFSEWKGVLDQFLEVTKASLQLVELLDIEVENGGTLLISANTHALYAKNVRIHGTGRIVCQGNISCRFNSLQGLWNFPVPGKVPSEVGTLRRAG